MIDFDELDHEEELQRKRRVAFVDFWPGFMDNTDRWVSIRWFHDNLLGAEIVDVWDDPEVIIFSLFGQQSHLLKSRRRSKFVMYIGENVRPPLREIPLCLSYDHVKDVPCTLHTRLPLWVLNKEVHAVIRLHEARLHGTSDQGAFIRQNFCCWVASNAIDYDASTRLGFVELLASRYKEVACGGSVRNNVGGPVQDKLKFLKSFKFNIAFENASHPGYCTEKVLHAFAANCVPIYWGDPHMRRQIKDADTHTCGTYVEPDFNPAALISAHDFDSFEDLVDYIIKVDEDPKLYESYLRQPILSEHWYEKLRNWSDFQKHLSDIILSNADAYRGDEEDVEDFAF